MDIFIPGELPGLNKVIDANRTNRYRGASVKRRTTDSVMMILLAQRVIPLPDVTHIWEFTWTCRDRRRDPDNIASAVKFVFDGMIAAGVIRNDGWKQVAEIHHLFEVGPDVGVRVQAVPTL